MQRFQAGSRAVLIPAAVVLAALGTPTGVGATVENADIRVADVHVSDDGRVSLVVAGPALRTLDDDLIDALEVREDGDTRDVDVRPIAAGDVEVAVVVDTAAEQAPRRLRELQNIAVELGLRLPRETPMALVAAGDPPAVEQAATTDVLQRVAAAGRLEPRGGRAIYDALAMAVDELSARPDARRSVVLVGAADDRASRATPDEVRERLSDADAALYVVHPDAAEAHPLDDVATATGGLVIRNGDREPLDAAAAVLGDLMHQYRLTFDAQGGGDAAVSIRVATEAVSAETTVNVQLPGVQPDDDTEVLGAPERSPLESARSRRVVVVAAALTLAVLLAASTALVITRRPAGRHSAADRATSIPPAMLLQQTAPATGQGARARVDPAAPAGVAGPGRRATVLGRTPRRAGAALGMALHRAWVALVGAAGALRRALGAVSAGLVSLGALLGRAFPRVGAALQRAWVLLGRVLRRAGAALIRAGAATTNRLAAGARRTAGGALAGARRTGAVMAGGAAVGARGTAAVMAGGATMGARGSRVVARGAAVGARQSRSVARAAVAGARRSRAVLAGGVAVGTRAAARLLRAAVSAGRAVRRGLTAAVRPLRPARRQPAPAWPEIAAQIHHEVGGDEVALKQAAARIESARYQTAAALRAAGFEGRLAMAFLTPLPVAVGVFRAVVDPTYLEQLTAEVLGWAALVVTVILTVAGGLWLRRIARPPFAALPPTWRAYRERTAREGAIADALDRASLYATAGLDLDTALGRAAPGTDHPAHGLRETLRALQSPAPRSGDRAQGRERAPDWLAAALRWWSEDLPAPDLLAAARARLHASWVWEADQRARRIPASALLPFLVCIAPATALAGLGAGP